MSHTKFKLRQSRKSVQKLLFAFGALGLFCAATTANATIYEFELEGKINAPVTTSYTWWPQDIETGAKVTSTIDRGDLVLTFDDQTGETKISGQSALCVGWYGCGGTGNFNYFTGDGISYFGHGQFVWDFTLTNPIAQGGVGEVTYGAQDPGQLTLQDPNVFVPDEVDLFVLEHDTLGYAFRLSDTGVDGIYTIDAWIELLGGVIGTKVRLESLGGEAVFNTTLTAYCTNCGTGGGDPPTDVPEPATLGLLLAGLLGAAKGRNKLAQ